VRYAGWIFIAGLCAQAQASDARFGFFKYEGTRMEAPAAQAGPGAYNNPILSGYAPDPSLVRVGQDYYLVNSSFAHFPGLPVYHSKDLVSWTQIGNAIDRPSQVNFSGLGVSRGLFAPDIAYHEGTFYIVNTCVDCGGNFVITAKKPAGPWSNPVWLGFDGIDPSLFWNDDGKAYVLNNGLPDEKPRYSGHRALWIQQFEPKTLKMIGPRTQIVNGGTDLSKHPIWIEGPHLFKKDNVYYLIAAEGGTGEQHSEVVFRGQSVTGPFTPYAHNPILTQRDLPADRKLPVTSAGHAQFVQTQRGDWWAAFLAVRPYAPDQYNIGRETFLLPVTWKDGWPVILEQGVPVPFVAQRPHLPPQAKPALPTSGDFSYRDDFKASRLAFSWIGIRTPAVPFYHLEDGDLVLHAGPPIGNASTTPAFIGRRQQHHNATFTTSLTYTPSQNGARAGLIAIASDEAYLFFGITREAGKTALAVTRNGSTLAAKSLALPAHRPVNLKLTFRGGEGAVSYSLGRNHWTVLKNNIDVSFLDTHKSGGFVGTVVGLYNSQN
jgi:alpha-N-arabinofuranosidase